VEGATTGSTLAVLDGLPNQSIAAAPTAARPAMNAPVLAPPTVRALLAELASLGEAQVEAVGHTPVSYTSGSSSAADRIAELDFRCLHRRAERWMVHLGRLVGERGFSRIGT
jgi:hypothetical protein